MLFFSLYVIRMQHTLRAAVRTVPKYCCRHEKRGVILSVNYVIEKLEQ